MTNEFTPDPREERLPKWAQAELESLRHKIKTERGSLELVRREGETRGVRIWLNPYSDNLPVGDGSIYDHCRFVLNDEHNYVDVRRKMNAQGEPVIELMASGAVAVRARATNVVVVSVDER